MDAYPVENLLRPPVEFTAAAACAAGAGALWVRPEWFAVAQPVAWALGLGLALWSGWRFSAGLRLVRYQRGLRKLGRYALASSRIPVSRTGVFVGRGFEWEARHVARLAQAREPLNTRFAKPTPAYRAVRSIERACERRGWTRLQRLLASDNALNPWRPLPKVGGNAALHAVGMWEGDREIVVDMADRVGHMLVVGATRVGKSRLLELTLAQDVRRGDNVVVLFDPKGDAGLMKRAYAEAARAGRPFYLFHLAFPELSARYNPIGDFTRVTEVATRIANNLPSEGQSAAFRDFVWRYVNVIARTSVALGDKPSYRTIYRHATHIDPLLIRYFERVLDSRPECADWRSAAERIEVDPNKLDKAMKGRMADAIRLVQYVKDREIHDEIADALAAIFSNEKSYFEKLVSSLFPLLEKLTTGKAAELVAPDYLDEADPRPVFDWETVINQRAVVYVGLDALTDREVATAVGNAMLADLTSTAGRIYNRGAGYGQPGSGGRLPIILKIDEFNELIGEEAVPMLNKSGGADFQVECYTQSIDDIEARLGSRPKAKQVLSNFNTLIMLRVVEEQTARYLTDKLEQVPVPSLVPASAATDTNDPTKFDEFGSRNEDRLTYQDRPLLTPADVGKLPRGQAFVLMDGGSLVKLRMPLPAPDPGEALPESIEHMAQAMLSRYECAFGAEETSDEGPPGPAAAAGRRTLTVEGKGVGF